MSKQYQARDIEVLTGLEPVQRRPGMYTDTSHPNHLIQEVIDNSVDEALAGHCKDIEVTLHEDGSIEVTDNGRGMPVDIHPEHGIPGVELILTRLHAGGKFSNENYQFAGGLHGVGVSVVNALSTDLDVWIKRDGQEYHMGLQNGDKVSELKVIGSVGQRNTGTRLRFLPDPKYFDSPKIIYKQLRHLLRAKAVLCPGLHVVLCTAKSGEKEEWQFNQGLEDYLQEALLGINQLPEQPFTGEMKGSDSQVSWALCWLPEGGQLQESYVNLIPTLQGGTHVNGLRTGMVDALREFCEMHNLLPRGVRLAPDDIWDRIAYILSVKMSDPQFSGQTKERLSSRACATFVSGVLKDAFSLWLNQNVADGEAIAALAISNAQKRMKKNRQVVPKKVTSGPALPDKLACDPTVTLQIPELLGCRIRCRTLQPGGPRHLGRHRRRSRLQCHLRITLRQSHHPRRCRLRRPAYRHAAMRPVPETLPRPGRNRSRICSHATPVSNRYRQGNPLRTGRRRTPGHHGCDRSREKTRQDHGNPLQRPRRNEPPAITRKHRRPGYKTVGAANDRQRYQDHENDGYVARQKKSIRPKSLVRRQR